MPRVADKLGVNIGVENVWNKFLTGPMEFKQFLDQFDSPRIGAYFDVGNVIINGYPDTGSKSSVPNQGRAREELPAPGLRRRPAWLRRRPVDRRRQFHGGERGLAKLRYQGPITAEMLPFSRLPNMVLPDMELAKKTAAGLKKLFAVRLSQFVPTACCGGKSLDGG